MELFFFCETRDVEKRITTQKGSGHRCEWSDTDASRRRADARRTWARRRSERVRRREGRSRASSTEATKLGRLSSCQRNRASERARPPVLHHTLHACTTSRVPTLLFVFSCAVLLVVTAKLCPGTRRRGQPPPSTKGSLTWRVR